jgi:hypothetical protein
MTFENIGILASNSALTGILSQTLSRTRRLKDVAMGWVAVG